MPQATEEDLDWGMALATLRIARGWTQGQLGQAVGLGYRTVSNYEQGLRTSRLIVLRQMVAAMGFPAHLLDRARALIRWARAARQLYRQPAADAAGACVEVMAGAAGLAREDLTRVALAGVLRVSPGDEPAPGEGVAPGAAAAVSRSHKDLAAARAGAAAAPPDKSSMPLPDALRVLRLIAGLEREELGAAIGATKLVIQNYERGVTPPPAGTLQRLLNAMNLPAEVFDRTVRFLDAARGARQAQGREGAAWLRASIEHLAAEEASRVEEGTRAWLGRLRTAARLLESRRRAPALWARLEHLPHASRRALVREAAEFQDAGLCELLCEESLKAAGDSARQALHLAQLAVLAAKGVAGEEGWRRRVEGYCLMHLANALRVGGKLPAAGEALTRAVEQWQAGAHDDPRLLNEARVLEIEASLRREKRDLPEALALLDHALAIDRWGETPSLLIGKSKALEEAGDFAGSIALLRQAAPLLDGEREPRKLFCVHQNLAINLCHLGQHGTAALGLPEVRALAQRLGNQLDWLRVGWLEARLAAGMGRIEEAVAGFERVRAAFGDQRIAYDAALVTVELAELHATLGRTADVKALARESAPVFREQGVHREARRALELFRRAAEEERASVELIHSVLSYLQRARRNSTLRYREAA